MVEPARSLAGAPWRDAAGRLALAMARHPAWTVFLCAVILRFAAVIALRGYVDDAGGDSVRYLSLARDILMGRPYGASSGDITRVPLYPIFIALHVSILGASLLWVSVTQAILDAITAVMLGSLAVSLSGRSLGWGVGALWAVYPPAVLNSPLIFPYPLQVFWLTLATLLIVSGVRHHSLWRLAAAGAFWGAACLTRAGYLLFVPVFAMLPLLLAWGSPLVSRRRRIMELFVVMAATAATVGWWSARDFPESGRLEYLFLNGHERRVIRLTLGPVEPVHARFATGARWAFAEFADLRQRAATHFFPDGPPATSWALIKPSGDASIPFVEAEERAKLLQSEIANVKWEYQRMDVKLRQALLAPDGCVQLQCSGPPGGYWAHLRGNVREAPVGSLLAAFARPCMALKALMYLQHWLLLLMTVPALVWWLHRRDGFGLYAMAFIAFTLTGIVFASNYAPTIGAVPRYAFALTPTLLLLVGTWLVGMFPPLRSGEGV